MYPPQTSLIPVTVALARFIEVHGFSGNYPYWYLGVPVKYLSGPIVSGVLVGLHQMFSLLSFFQLSYLLIFISFILGALGWGVLAGQLANNKKLGLIVALLFLILPWKWLTALALAETSVTLAQNILPWTLIILSNYLTRSTLKRAMISILSVLLLLLIHTSVIPSMVIGVAAIIFGRNNWLDAGKKAGWIFLGAIILATFWYTPGFWWTILINPSLGGNSGWRVIFNVFDWLKMLLPVALAVMVISFSVKVKNKLTVFSLVWLLTFSLLTIFRFLADVDFWQDWSSWFWELEIGFSLGVVMLSRNMMESKKRWGGMIILAILPFLLSFYIYGKLGSPVLISPFLPIGISSLDKLNQIADGKRVFLSGSTVFWADSLYDLKQVRGGRDEVTTNHSWQKYAYDIRESQDPQLTQEALNNLGVSYVLVHGPDSTEYYHDFKNIEKWDRVGKKIWSGNGDSIYDLGLAQKRIK